MFAFQWFHSWYFVPNGPPGDRLSETVHTTRSHHCSEFICVFVNSKVPTSSKFGLCFLLGSGRGIGTQRESAQWNAQDQDTIYPVVDDYPLPDFSHPQAATPSPVPQDSSPTPPAHLFLDPKVIDDNPQSRRANATLMILARGSDLDGVIQSMEQVESKFNRKFKYPWVLLNEVEFSAEFKR